MTDNELVGLGRLRTVDERDRKYLLRAAPTAYTQRYWHSPGVMDQGATSQCVAYSGVKYLTTAPVYNKPLDPPTLYNECQRVDEWPGEDYDGTSVRALFKVLKSRALIKEYRWAFDCEPVVNHLLTVGPVVMGTVWTMEMFMPDRHYYIEPKGEVVGGHAWLLIGTNRNKRNPDGTRGAVRMINSWGVGWADKGRAWLTFKNLDWLIKADGEACVATEVKATL